MSEEESAGDEHTVIEAECLQDDCDELETVTHLEHARTDKQTELVLDAHIKAAQLHEEEAGHEFNVSVDTGTPEEMADLYEELSGDRLIADGGEEVGQATHHGRNLNKTMDDLFPQESSRQCRVCNEPVVDGRWNYCSPRCRDIAQAVHKMFQWSAVRARVLERDDYTCQRCGLSKAHTKRAYWQTHELAKEKADSTEEFWQIWRNYGVTSFQIFEVDHIERVADGGHPFDESNLQTLCEPCHEEKTVEENSGRGGPKPSVTLEDYVES